MRRNPYFHVLLTLLVIHQGCRLTYCQAVTVHEEVKTNSQSSITSGNEVPATQFNIFGRNAPAGIENSEISNPIVNNQNDNAAESPFAPTQIQPISSRTVDEQITPSAAESSLLPSNFSSPYTAKKPYKKPKVILTLSLRSKESDGPTKKNSKDPKSPFLFGNNVIKYDTRTNRLIIPTTTDSLEVTETTDSSEEVGKSSEELGGSTVISVITEGPLLEVQNRTLTALKILEKLRALEHARLNEPHTKTTQKPVPKQPWYGYKKYETLHPRLRKTQLSRGDEQVQASTQVATTVKNNTVVEYTTLSSKVGGHLNQTPGKLQSDASTPIPKETSASSGPPSPFYSSTPPIVLKVGTLAVNTRFQNGNAFNSTPTPVRMADSMASGSEIDSSTTISKELIKTGETRVAITADQVGGNRPTQRPFHFGPTTQPPSTTTVISDYRQKNRVHAIGKSPHNHAYAPTEDPVSNVVVHNDDLSVEDFQDFRLANAVFGSKVGADVPTVRPVAPRPPPISPGLGNRYAKENDVELSEEYDDEPPLPVRLLQENVKRRPQVIIKTTPPTTTTTTVRTTPRPVFIPERRRPGVERHGNNPRAPQLQASSGVKNSQVVQNDNLPFYKEPGGIFKEHTPNHLKEFSSGLEDDEESNFIPQNTFNERPGVKYAPKAPSAHSQPQTVYANHLAGNSNRHTNHYNQHPHQQPHHHQPQVHHHSSQPQYVPVTQAPIYLQHQQPIVHHPQQFAVIPSVTPQVVVSPLHQRPQQQPIYYHSQQPALVAAVVPTQPLYQQPSPGSGLVPILHPQQAYAAAPVQPQYIPQNQYHQNQPRRGNFPHRNDPNSDDYFGDPTPDDNNGKKNRNRGGGSGKNQQPKRKNNEYQENEDRSFERGRYPPPPAPPAEQQKRYQGSRNDDPPVRYDDRGDRNGNRRNTFNGDEERRGLVGNNNERNRFNGRNGPVHSGRRHDGNIDEGFDHAAEAGLKDLKDDDFVEPNFDNPRPAYDDAPDLSGRARGQSKIRFDDDRNGRDYPTDEEKPFRPSPQDFGPIRPSNPDFGGPSFDHPNLQYPQPSREQQQQPRRNSFDEGPEYDPRGFGVGHGPPPSNNVQLDPIYTRTLKQFDEEHKRKNVPQRNNDDDEPPPRRNSHRPSGQRVTEEPEEHHDDEEEDHREQKPHQSRRGHNDDEENDEEDRRRPPPRRNEEGEQDEDDRRRPPPRRNEEGEQDEDDRRRPPPRRHEEEEEDDEEETAPDQKNQRDDEEEEGEEEESRNQPAKSTKNDEEDEEEEEENEEQQQEKPPRNRQRNPKKSKSPKKRNKKPPPNEKAGDLEDDIRDINQEFGGGIIFEQSKHPIIFKTPSGIVVNPSPAASSVSPSSASFQLSKQQQQQPYLLKSPSTTNNATEIIPVLKLPKDLIKPSSISNVTSFNIHLLEADVAANNNTLSHKDVIVDM